MGVSVVPTTTWPCQGMAKSTRPSLVCGTMMAASPSRNERSKTRWTPWLGSIIGGRAGIGEPAHFIGEDAGGVDDDLCGGVEDAARFRCPERLRR